MQWGKIYACYSCYIFCKFLLNSYHNLEPVYIIKKPIKRRFQQNLVCTEILSTFHTRVKYISAHSNEWGGANAKKSQKQTLPLRHVDPHSVHQCLGPVHSPCQTTAQLVHTLPHNYATKSPLVTMGCPNFTPKTAPFPLVITTPILYIYPSNNPTYHHKRHLDLISRFATIHFADRATDRQTDKMVLANVP